MFWAHIVRVAFLLRAGLTFTSHPCLLTGQALCAAVVKPDVLETMALLFSGADVMCATGDPVHCTPYLLAKKAGQSLQMEFLYHNKFSGLSATLY